MQLIASTRPSSTWIRHNLHDVVRLQLEFDTTSTMVPPAPPVVAPPPGLRSDWETLIQLASMRSKPLDLDACPRHLHPPIGFVAQLTNRSPAGFDAQTNKLSWWFWVPNHHIVACLVLRHKPINRRGDRKTLHHRFWGQTGWNYHIGFEAKPLINRPNDFEVKPLTNCRPCFEAQSRNSCSSFSRAQCRPHTASPDFSIVRPPSTQPVRSSPILCTRSPTPATILVAGCHATPGTCTPRNKQTQFSNKKQR
jgi:hypothetical protein